MRPPRPPPTTQVQTGPVYRPRNIYGRRRVAGHLVFYHEPEDDPGDLHLVYVLGNGAMAAVDGIWIDGRRLSVRRGVIQDGTILEVVSDTRPGDSYNGAVTAYAYLAADGTGGSSLRAVTTDWTTDHRLEGLSWVHVRLRQPQGSRLFQAIPEVEFLVRGRTETWPGQAAAAWSENAAVIRHAVRRSFLGETAADYDGGSVTDAISTCGALLTGGAILDAEFDGRHGRVVPDLPAGGRGDGDVPADPGA